MKKNYIIVGSNNFWYSTLTQATDKELAAELKRVKTGIKKNEYEEASTLAKPENLFVFETKLIQQAEL